ncbi:lipopolysaccharide biosynthesis protein [Thermodesulfobacteriota bacterium]
MLVKNAIAYSGTNLISQVALFIQGLVLRNLLPPQIMGLWEYVKIARGFLAHFSIGILTGAVRELPLLKGQMDEKGQQDSRSVSLTYSLTEVTIVSICVVIYAMLRKNLILYDEYFALLLTAALLFFMRFQESYLTFFQGAQLYVPLSKLLFINSFILAISLPIGAVLMGLWGVFLGALVAEGLKAVWIFIGARSFGIRPEVKWNFQIFKRLASFGILYKINDYPLSLFLMLDALWVTKFMDLKSLAIYAMIRSFFLQGSEITIRFGTVFYTRMMEQYGKNEDKAKIAGDIDKFIHLQLLVAIPLVCWAIFSVVPFVIRQVTPSYAEGIYPLAILLIANFFEPRNNNLFTVWIAEKRLGSYGKANLFSLASMLVAFSLAWFLIGSKTLSSVAIAVVSGYLVSFIYILFTIGKEMLGIKESFSLFIKIILTAIWAGGILIYFGSKEVLSMSFSNDIVFSLKKTIIIFALFTPVIFIGMKNSGAQNLLYNWWKTKKSV